MSPRDHAAIRLDYAVALANDPNHGGAATPDPASRRFQQHAAITEHRRSPQARATRRARRLIAGRSRRMNRVSA